MTTLDLTPELPPYTSGDLVGSVDGTTLAFSAAMDNGTTVFVAPNPAASGADVHQGHRVVDVSFDADGVTTTVQDAESGRRKVRGRAVIDASGRVALLSRKFELRIDELAVAAGDDMDAPVRLVGVEGPATDVAGEHAVDKALDRTPTDQALRQPAGPPPQGPPSARSSRLRLGGDVISQG